MKLIPITQKIIVSTLFGALIFTHSFSLSAQELLEEVVVVASRTPLTLREVTSSVSILDSEDIQLQAQPSLTALLRTQPSVTGTNTGGVGKATAIRIRGEEGFRTLMLIDGMEISDPSATQVLPLVQHVVGSHFDRIEILRGPQAFIYGADAGGVVSIQTARPKKNGYSGQMHAESGSFDSHQLGASFAAKDETKDFFLSADDTRTAGFNARTDDPTEDKDGYDARTMHARAGWEDHNWRLQAVARHVDTETEFDACGFPVMNACLSLFEQLIGKVSADHDGETVDQHIGISRSKINRESGVIGQMPFSNIGVLEKLEYLAKVQINSDAQLAFGGDFRHEEQRASGNETRRDQAALFGEWQGAYNEKVYVTAGLRYDDNQNFGEHVSGRVSGAYVSEFDSVTLKYRGSIGTGFRAPSLSEIGYNEGPFAFGEAAMTELKEETSEGAEMALEAYFANDAHAEIVIFYQEVLDQIEFDLAGFSGYLQGEGKSRSHGIELSGGMQVSNGIEVNATFTYNDTQTDDGLQRLRRPLWSGNLSITGHWMEDRLKAFLNYRTARNRLDVGRMPLDNYGVLSAAFQYDWSEQVNTFIRIENATDKNYQEVGFFNTAERSAYAGVRLSF